MKTARNLFLFVTYVCLIAYAVFSLFFEQKPEPETIEVVKYDTIVDTIHFKKPVPVYRDSVTYQIVELPADTQTIIAALNRLNTLNVYQRQLVNDSLLQVTITDSVQFNELKGGSVEYKYHQKTIQQTVIQEVEKKQKYAILIGVSAVSSGKTMLIPSVGCQFSNSQVFLSGNNEFFTITYNYKIFKR